MLKLTINLPGHKFNGADVMVTYGILDSAYFHRGVRPHMMKHPVPVIILSRGSAVELMDIFEADELRVSVD